MDRLVKPMGLREPVKGERRRVSGFTLIEAVAALAILGTLMYMAASSLLGLVPKYRLEKAVGDVRAALNTARVKALIDGTSMRVRFLPDGFALESYDDAAEGWRQMARRGLEGVSVSANNTPIFTPEGTVTGLATITVTNRWGGYRVTLAITGRVKTARITS